MVDTPSVGSEIGPKAWVPLWVLAHGLSGGELATYLALRSFSDASLGSGKSQGIYPHVETLAERAYVTVRTAERAISKLRDLGLLTSVRRHNERGWVRGCDYRLADLPVWPDRQDGRLGPDRPSRRGVTDSLVGEVTDETVGAVSIQFEESNEESSKDWPAGAGPATSPPSDALFEAPGLAATPPKQQASAKLKAAKTAKATRATRAPDNLPIAPEMRAWAAANGIVVDLEAETSQFLDWHRGKGSTHVDWIASWRNWMRRTLTFGSKSASTARAPMPARGSYPEDPFAA
ncbi:helix-turn-helix domain-containing protein [Amycolatopsis sp. H20-H5]|uniref:helix-turn-helix domain-containing protein n=1 Tax=Amycolatopsis sp. H20-H5 TaxID=3046309 RepID=UPI002DBAA58B|nr:helix-turn-helix domain-containing protein [Amycolatopsis sp. H20-H5]MEC3974751.1 helix-turn-helix domain-containing protein [Amycolatopsis sp. H20-H5]